MALAAHLFADCFCQRTAVTVVVCVAYEEGTFAVRHIGACERRYLNSLCNSVVNCFCCGFRLVDIDCDQVISLADGGFNRVYLIHCIRLGRSVPCIIDLDALCIHILYRRIDTGLDCVIPRMDIFVCAVDFIAFFLRGVRCIKALVSK